MSGVIASRGFDVTVYLRFVLVYLTVACFTYLLSILNFRARKRAGRIERAPLFLVGYRSLVLAVGLVLWLAIASPTFASTTAVPPELTAVSPERDQLAAAPAAASGATLFTENCAACHANGGNIIRRGKNLKQRAMTRNGYGNEEAIAEIVTQGKGIMPAYADRLSAKEIRVIAQYVHEQSESGW